MSPVWFSPYRAFSLLDDFPPLQLIHFFDNQERSRIEGAVLVTFRIVHLLFTLRQDLRFVRLMTLLA
jgi:hypothetical protein